MSLRFLLMVSLSESSYSLLLTCTHRQAAAPRPPAPGPPPPPPAPPPTPVAVSAMEPTHGMRRAGVRGRGYGCASAASRAGSQPPAGTVGPPCWLTENPRASRPVRPASTT